MEVNLATSMPTTPASFPAIDSISGSKVIKSLIAKTVYVTGWVFAALILGFVGLLVLYPGASILVPIIAATIYMCLAGLLIGYFNPKMWLISGLVGWGGALLAGASLMGKDSPGIVPAILSGVSIGPAFLGGFLGKQLQH